MPDHLNQLLASAGLELLADSLALRFDAFYSLLARWNARTNLTAIRDEEGILSRHFVESIACARALPSGIGTLLDFGSGAGFPGIPIALCRPEIAVTLAESQGKKAAFLREAVRTLELGATVYSQRAELLATRFDCVALRAVDRMGDSVRHASGLVAPGGCLVILTTGSELADLQAVAGPTFSWSAGIAIPDAGNRILAFGTQQPETGAVR